MFGIGCLIATVTSECVIESVVSGVGLGISIYTCAKKKQGLAGINKIEYGKGVLSRDWQYTGMD